MTIKRQRGILYKPKQEYEIIVTKLILKVQEDLNILKLDLLNTSNEGVY